MRFIHLLIALLVASLEIFARPLVVGYVTVDDRAASLAVSLDFDQLTHLNLAFENPINDGGDLSHHPGDTVLLEAARAHGVKVLVSIGGGAAPEDPVLSARYARLLSPPHRAAFAASLRAYVEKHHFDGLDVDIEGPMITEDYNAFIIELATAFADSGKLLTAALSEGYGGKGVSDSTLQHFAFVNIMAYDGTGPWDPATPGQHSSFDYAVSNVQYWLDRGLPKCKAVLGVPFYGYGFGKDFREGGYTYAQILERFPDADTTDEAGSTIWYNGRPTISAKAAWAKTTGLAGVMIWSLESDVPGEKSLLKAVAEGLGNVPARETSVSK